jgi:hypothetical protein
MTEKIEYEPITRRKTLSLFGLSAAFSLAVPVTLSSLSDAEAQTAGMDRRQDRREGRHDRREDRRDNRQDRRETRRGGGSKPESTGTGTGTGGDTGTK